MSPTTLRYSPGKPTLHPAPSDAHPDELILRALMKAEGINAVIAETDKNLVVLNLADGKELWRTAFAGRGMGGYNASTPIAEGSTIIFSGSGRGTKAVKLEREGDHLA